MKGIYKITNKINKKSYIGQSIDITTRWRRHKNYPIENSKYPLYKAFQKYGIENFDFEIIEECPIADLDKKEIFYIQKFNAFYNGYNQTQGGSGTRGFEIKISLNDLYEIYDLLQNSTLTQREISKLYNVGEDTISEINQGKTRVLEGFIFPLRSNKNSINYCIDCGKEISKESIRCSKCHNFLLRKVQHPNREDLKLLIRNKSFLEIGRQFGVSDNTIRKWCISENLPSKKSEIKLYTDDEWDKI